MPIHFIRMTLKSSMMKSLWKFRKSRLMKMGYRHTTHKSFPYMMLIRCSMGFAASQPISPRPLQADEKLQQSEARLSGIIQVANDAIITVDHSQNIILFNQSAERVFGYSSDEVLGRSLDMLLPERFHHRHRENIRYFEGGGRYRRAR